MPRSTRTFRVFVSSTFADLKAERNALQDRVFPALRELCLRHGCRFQAIDLRWGVNQEASLDQRTLAICLEEVARCQATTPRPNFILLLGDRYGWRPLPYEIPAPEFELLARAVTDPEERRLLGLARPDEGWYRRDENADPPVYVLRSREGVLEDQAAWEARVERPLRRTLARAALACGLTAEARLKYEASATEQEIEAGALQAADARSHVFGFFRAIEDLPRDPSAADYRDFTPDWEPDPDAEARLAALKRRLRRRLRRNVRTYRAGWTGTGATTDHLETLCRDVLTRLGAVIRREIARLEDEDALEAERTAHAAFGTERSAHFTGRDDDLAAIQSYLESDRDETLVVWGQGGGGKSALVAEAARRARERHGRAIILTRFVGATPASGDGGGLLASVCAEIGRAYRQEEVVPGDFRLLVQEFPRRLGLAQARRPLWVFLDALDQLASPEEVTELDWVPTRLPPHAKLIVSVATGDSLDRLRERLPRPRFQELPAMEPPEGERLLRSWLAADGRTLTNDQQRAVERRFAETPLPIYLKLAFGEVRRWRSFDGVGPLGAGVPGIVRTLFERLAERKQHGAVLTRKALALLLAGRNGVTEDELLDLLSDDASVLEDFRNRNPRAPAVNRLPVVVWSRLYFDLEPYLTERQADGTRTIGFYHRQVAELFRRDHVGDAVLQEAHRALASYFARQPHWLRAELREPHRRKASELPWQQLAAATGQARDELAGTLTDLGFAEMKCAAGATWDLIGDYERGWPREEEAPLAVRAFRSFLTAHATIFEREPGQVVPFAWNYAADGPVVRAAGAMLQTIDWKSHPWIELTDRPPWIEHPAHQSTLAGHEGAVQAVRLSLDGSVAVSGGEDDTLRIWTTRRALCRHIIPAGQGGVHAVALEQGGTVVVSGGADGTLKLWDVKSGLGIRGWPAHHGAVHSVALTGSGTVVSGGSDGLVKVWPDGGSSAPIVLAGHFGPINGVAVANDGQAVISGGEDRTLRIWDLERKRTRRVLEGHATPVQGVAADGNGWLIASCSGQVPDAGGIVPAKLLRSSEVGFWTDAGEGGPVGTGHDLGARGGWTLGVLASVVNAVAISDDGVVAVTGGYDGTVAVWRVRHGRLESRLFGHTGAVLDVALDGAGRLAASASADGTVRLWSLAGRSSPPAGPVRVVGRIGAGARAGIRERSRLLWRNPRVRRGIVLPAVAAGLGLLLAGPWDSLLAQLGGALPTSRLGAIGTVLAAAYLIEWRLVLKGDPHVWKGRVLPGGIRAVLGLGLLPLLPWFRILHCPGCGRRLAGRRHFLTCSTCGFRDRFPLALRRR
ncbi:MAG: DUF4062 domain-containing protein [Gemmatimonadales bacterium]